MSLLSGWIRFIFREIKNYNFTAKVESVLRHSLHHQPV